MMAVSIDSVGVVIVSLKKSYAFDCGLCHAVFVGRLRLVVSDDAVVESCLGVGRERAEVSPLRYESLLADGGAIFGSVA